MTASAEITHLSLLLVAHFIGDFVLQSHWMSVNKSSNWKALAAHVAVYGACLTPFGLLFALANAAIHGAVDAVTSRITKRLWLAQRWHYFFLVIGADQLTHYLCLLWVKP